MHGRKSNTIDSTQQKENNIDHTFQLLVIAFKYAEHLKTDCQIVFKTMPPWMLSAANKKQQEIAKTFHIKLIHNQTSDVDWGFYHVRKD